MSFETAVGYAQAGAAYFDDRYPNWLNAFRNRNNSGILVGDPEKCPCSVLAKHLGLGSFYKVQRDLPERVDQLGFIDSDDASESELQWAWLQVINDRLEIEPVVQLDDTPTTPHEWALIELLIDRVADGRVQPSVLKEALHGHFA